MNIQINGLTVSGTTAEMVDFIELWQARSVSLAAAAMDVKTWKDDCLKPTDVVVYAASDGSVTADQKKASPTANQPIGYATKVTGSVATVKLPIPKVKHTTVPPADAPVVKVPTGVSGKKPRGPVTNPGISSHIRLAIFNGMTQQKSIEKALGCEQKIASARIAALISLGHVEEVPQAEYIPGRRVFRLTEAGARLIESDKKKLRELGVLP